MKTQNLKEFVNEYLRILVKQSIKDIFEALTVFVLCTISTVKIVFVLCTLSTLKID